MKFSRIGIFTTALVALAGCSTLGADGKRIDYGSAAIQAKTLEVPPDLTAPETDDRFKMPQGDSGAAMTYSAYSKSGTVQSATPAAVLPDIPGVQLERDGGQRWLSIKDKPDNVWQKIKSFWLDNGLSIKSEEQAAGIMETDWMENRVKIPQTIYSQGEFDPNLDQKVYSVGERDQYSTRLERSKDGSGTEVHISQRGMEEVYSNDKKVSRWQARGNDPEKEAIMLQRMMVYFGASTDRAKDAVAPATPAPAASPAAPAAGKQATDTSAPDLAGAAALREISGNTIIVVNDAFDKTWRKVGLAIESTHLAVEDKDREKGIYYLSPIKIDVGWFDKLKFWKSNEDTDRHYRVNVKDGGKSCEVSITDQNGASNKASKQMLDAIYRNISQQ